MPGSPNTSFIPKHTANKVERRSNSRQMFIGTLLVRVLFFSVLIAAIAVFFYERKISNELATEVISFKEATKSFEDDEEKLQLIIAMDRKINLASERLQKGTSVLSVLKALEASAISTSEINNLEILRVNDAEVEVVASVITDTFDSVLFQRSILEESKVLGFTEISDIVINNLTDTQEDGASGETSIAFTAEIKIDPQTIPIGSINQQGGQEVFIPFVDPAAEPTSQASVETFFQESSSSTVDTEVTNQENI